MLARIRRKLSMAVTARDFATAHPVADASFAIVVKRLADTITQADTNAMQQTDGVTGERAARARRQGLVAPVRRGQLHRLVRIAELAAETHPELKGQFVMPRRGSR